MTQFDLDSWAEALSLAALGHNGQASPALIRQAFTQTGASSLDGKLARVAQRIGINLDLLSCPFTALPQRFLPAVVELTDGRAAVLTRLSQERAVLIHADISRTLECELTHEDLVAMTTGRIVALRSVSRVRDARLGEFLAPYTPSWFWSLIFKDKRRHIEIAIASLVGSLLALASSIFSMQVWDRVVPAESTSTLWVLAAGVMLAIGFEYLLRIARTRISDIVGKKVDLTISSLFFGRALDICNEARPKSTGSFISQIKEIDQIRELLASTTLTAAMDVPFAIIFLMLIWMLGGPLSLVVLAALPLIIVPGLLLQIPLARLSNMATREGSLRHAVLVEAIEGVEDIKALQAEGHFQRLWDQYTDATSKASLAQRHYVSAYVSWIQAVQQLSYVGIIVVGVYLVLANELTTGAVIGCSLLSSRAISPFAQLAQIFTKWQHATTARKGLDELLRKPLDHASDRERLQRATLIGNYELNNVELRYDPDAPPALMVPKLTIAAGEKVALVGRIGAGKSSLLKLLSGNIAASQGAILLDGTDMSLIDPSDVRRNVTSLSQDSRLFFGTLRENLMMGSPRASEQALMSALEISGAIDLIQRQSRGFDLPILEGGRGLSSGQRQAALLARTLLRPANILALDEPTAAMDDVSERRFIEKMKSWLGNRTLIVSTHRFALLELVDRVIVVNDGRIIMDGTVKSVMQRLKSGTSTPAPAIA